MFMGARFRQLPRGSPGLLLGALASLSGCAPVLDAGSWTCSDPLATEPSRPGTAPMAAPWSTSFEQQFCDYAEDAGFCYAFGQANYETVSSPVHSGRYAAAFSVVSDENDSTQTRCVRQGTMPETAYYGAWYFIPERAQSERLWNLFHFRGGNPFRHHGNWDVSLTDEPDGNLKLFVYDFQTGERHEAAEPIPIPIGQWFHVQLYLSRALDETGTFALYQDGQLLFSAENLVTADSEWGQWYVGNLAEGLLPPNSTLYVDDVSITDAL
jgi:hypothetical protein